MKKKWTVNIFLDDDIFTGNIIGMNCWKYFVTIFLIQINDLSSFCYWRLNTLKMKYKLLFTENGEIFLAKCLCVSKHLSVLRFFFLHVYQLFQNNWPNSSHHRGKNPNCQENLVFIYILEYLLLFQGYCRNVLVAKSQNAITWWRGWGAPAVGTSNPGQR